jgi:hypothetical protein
MLDRSELTTGVYSHTSMHIPDDLNNRRIRQLIEQFNTEEAHEAELRSAIEELGKLFGSDADLATSSLLCVERVGPCRRRPR